MQAFWKMTRSPLASADCLSLLDKVRARLAEGAEIDLADEDGDTALMFACSHGDEACASLLLEKCAEIDLAAKDGCTALILACFRGHEACARLLLEKGAKIDLADEDGDTARTLATRHGHAHIVSLLDAASAPKPHVENCTWVRYKGSDGDDGNWEMRKGLDGSWHRYGWGAIGVRCPRSVIDKAYGSPGTPMKIDGVGGSISISKKRVRELGLPVIKNSGVLRQCAAHAAYLLVRTLRPELKGADSSEAWFEKELPGTLDPKDDPSSGDIERVVGKHSIALEPVYNLSPHEMIQRGDSVFLLHLTAAIDGDQIRHFFVYDAKTGCILDPVADGNQQIEDTDRCIGWGQSKRAKKKANGKAMGPFYKAYPGALAGSIRIDRVWRGVVAHP